MISLKAHLAPINRRKDDGVIILQRVKMTMRKFADVRSNERTSNVFINPIHANSGTDMNGNGPPSDDSRGNFNVDGLYKHSGTIPTHSTDRRQSTKALKRFI